MEVEFAKAVRSGFALHRLDAAKPATEPQRASDTAAHGGTGPERRSAADASRGGRLRGIGRRVLAGLRPLAAPLLVRFDHRVRGAVDGSRVAERLRSVGQSIASIRQSVAENGQCSAELAHRLDSIGHSVAVGLHAQSEDLKATQDLLHRCMDTISRQGRLLDQLVLGMDRGLIALGPDFAARTPEGYLFIPAEDLRLIVMMSEGGRLEPGTRQVLASLLREGDRFVDVGANIGTMTLVGARAVGPTGRVVAVEPTPRLHDLLLRSLVMNGLADRVVIERCAAGERPGMATLHLGATSGHNSLLPLDGEGAAVGQVEVPVRPLDALVPAGTGIHVVKLDVEGSELAVWRGMRRIVADSPRLAVIAEFGLPHLRRARVATTDWLRELLSPGFEAYYIDENDGLLRPADEERLARVEGVNLLLLRPEAGRQHPELRFA